MNKIPILDHGYIEVISYHNDNASLASINSDPHFVGISREDMPRIGSLTLKVRLPFFMKSYLCRSVSNTIDVPDRIEFYVPSIDQLVVGSVQERADKIEIIKGNIRELTQTFKDILPHNHEPLLAACLLPSNVYATVIANGSVPEWLNFCNTANTISYLPYSAYSTKIKELIDSMWFL